MRSKTPEPCGGCCADRDDCIVCGDPSFPLRVLRVDGDDALCENTAAGECWIAVDLVAPVRPGDLILAHGGVAIVRVDDLVARAA